MIVNELAKRTGVAPHVVRYYARIGLLKPERDQNNGYKLFTIKDIQRLEFIRQAQQYGFSLSDISTVMEQNEKEGCLSCKTMYKLLSQRVNENKRKIEEMLLLQERMEAALLHWDLSGGGGCKGSPVCPAGTESDCPYHSERIIVR